MDKVDWKKLGYMCGHCPLCSRLADPDETGLFRNPAGQRMMMNTGKIRTMYGELFCICPNGRAMQK